MKNYLIITDSAADINVTLIDKYNIKVIPLLFTLEDKNYELTPKENEEFISEVYSKLREGKVITTSQANPTKFINYFEKFLKEGLDIIYLAFSSALSGTYQSACIAKEELEEKYQDRKIIVIDTLCASLGQGLMVIEAAKIKESGASIEEVEDFVINNRLKLVHYFTVDDLMFLKRGGRLSASSAFIGTMVQLKPILHVSNEGKLVPIGKVLGRKNSIKTIVNRIKAQNVDWENKSLFISHGDCFEDIQYVLECLNKENINPKEIIINTIGAVIGAHSGPGTIALFYLGNERG